MNRHFWIAGSAVFCLALASSGVRGAGTNAAEEAAIRKLITSSATPPRLADHIFWSGAYRRPTVGNEKAEPSVGPGSIENRVPSSQKSTTQPIRIVVADSRDLAYEYSKSTLEYDLKAGGHFKADTGLLRVWQKQDGTWKEAAIFVRPYDRDFAPPK
ncbi:MAG TPA: hypothetical protein VEF06_10645 [Bryobacteraceae bacterium]|nr:hypothetical protein [Bryobacteraceae bacterium]